VYQFFRQVSDFILAITYHTDQARRALSFCGPIPELGVSAQTVPSLCRWDMGFAFESFLLLLSAWLEHYTALIAL